MALASKAFRHLPENYGSQQATIRFCQGLLDKEAWQHVCVHGPKSMEEAINNVRWFEHVHHDVYGNMAMTESRTAFQDP